MIVNDLIPFKEIKIRVYKATNNISACKRFAQGHSDVLNSYGIKKITSSDTSWFKNPSVYLIMVESIDGSEIYGGAKLHIKNKKFKLPLETALGELDPKVIDLIEQYEENKTGELCGLWNTRDMSGTGLSILLTRVGLAEAGILTAHKLELETLYILCAPWTVQMVKNVGFEVETNIGNNGTFFYPKPDLLATLLSINDINTLKKAKNEERLGIFDLRKNPTQTKLEDSPKGKIEVEYNLDVTSEMHNMFSQENNM